MMVDVLLTDCHSKCTFRPQFSSAYFEGTGRIGVIFLQICMTRNTIYNKLFLVEYNKVLLFNKGTRHLKRLANKPYSQ